MTNRRTTAPLELFGLHQLVGEEERAMQDTVRVGHRLRRQRLSIFAARCEKASVPPLDIRRSEFLH